MPCHARSRPPTGVSLIVAMWDDPCASAPSARRARTERAVAVMPSTSKSPKTRMRFLPSRAARRQSTNLMTLPGNPRPDPPNRARAREPGTNVRHRGVDTTRDEDRERREPRLPARAISCARLLVNGGDIQSGMFAMIVIYGLSHNAETRSFPPMRLLDGTRDLVRIPETGRDRRPASIVHVHENPGAAVAT